MKMTLVQMQHASMVAKCGSFSEAARRFNVAQPTISNTVSDLEEILGQKVFERTTRRVSLTAFGRAMMPHIDEALMSVSRVQSEAATLLNPAKKLLRIAFTPLLEIETINALCTAYRQRHPNVEIIFKQCEHGSLTQRLKDEQIDVVCAHDIPHSRSFSRCELFKDNLRYIPPYGDASGFSGTADLPQIARLPLLLTAGDCGLTPTVLKLFEEQGLTTEIYKGRAMTHADLRQWADLGLGGAILPETKISDEADRFPIVTQRGQSIRAKYEAVWLKPQRAIPHLRMFFDQLPQIGPTIK